MNTSTGVGLIATLHDPEARFVPFIQKLADSLGNLYACIEIIATPITSQQTIQSLETHKLSVHLKGGKEIGASRREAIKAGLIHAGINYFHYCDFDRILFWMTNFPEELEHMVSIQISQADYTAIGRTQTAWETHPAIQIETEKISNGVFSYAVGREMDVTAGSCGMSRPAAELILSLSKEPTNATDTEWPSLIQFRSEGKLSLAYKAVEGLAFETPTFHGDSIYQTLVNTDNYLRRIILAQASVEAVFRVLKEAKSKAFG